MSNHEEKEAKTDCFGYQNGCGTEWCSALNGLYCKHEECVFYKQKTEKGGKENE